MPIKLPPTDNAAAQATKPSTYNPQATRPAATTTPPRSTAPADDYAIPDEGVGYEEGDRTTAGGTAYPRGDSFAPLEAGEYDFLVSINKVVPWHFGTRLTLRVEYGEHRGRQVEWEQSPPQKLTSSEALAIWRSTLFGAYAAGGWPLEADDATGWPGWKKVPSGNVPPYYLVGVHEAPDEAHVPVLLRVHVSVRAGYEKFHRVTSVRQYLDGSGNPVQAPLPYAVPEWMQKMHKWQGTREDLVIKSGENAGRTIPLIKLQFDQFKVGHCKMTTWRDLK